MGIPSLLRLLVPVIDPIKFEDLKGLVAAVDTSIWIHHIAHFYPDAETISKYVFHQAMLLREYSIEPLLVFDGKRPEVKREVALEREKKQKLMTGTKDWTDPKGTVFRSEETQDAIKTKCRQYGIQFVQSPYESDAQITYLLKIKMADFAITEDSDFIVFGCERVLYKMESSGGEMYDQSKLAEFFDAPFDLECLRAASILIGCDYLKRGLQGFGTTKLYDTYKQLDQPFNYDQMVKLLETKFPDKITEQFEASFQRAFQAFKHQLVYDPITETVVPLCPYPVGTSAADFSFAGRPDEAVGENFKPPEGFEPPVTRTMTLPTASMGHRLVVCLNCDEVLSSMAELRAHREKEHPLICPTCKRTFLCLAYLKDHMGVHGLTPNHLCECGHACWTEASLTVHRRRNHRDERYACSLCSSEFKRNDDLQRHMTIHSEERPFICEDCGASFKHQNDLGGHRRYAHGKVYACTDCDKVFTRPYALKIHMAFHSNSTMFTCEVCQKQCSTQSNLNLHMRVHAEKKFKCPHCIYDCTRNNVLQAHILKYHSENAEGDKRKRKVE